MNTVDGSLATNSSSLAQIVPEFSPSSLAIPEEQTNHLPFIFVGVICFVLVGIGLFRFFKGRRHKRYNAR